MQYLTKSVTRNTFEKSCCYDNYCCLLTDYLFYSWKYICALNTISTGSQYRAQISARQSPVNHCFPSLTVKRKYYCLQLSHQKCVPKYVQNNLRLRLRFLCPFKIGDKPPVWNLICQYVNVSYQCSGQSKAFSHQSENQLSFQQQQVESKTL